MVYQGGEKYSISRMESIIPREYPGLNLMISVMAPLSRP
jgi:hypothetical protein